jgi:Chitobiase/beta-hexosaminidase C-terminal domain
MSAQKTCVAGPIPLGCEGTHDFATSAVASATYTQSMTQVAQPTFSPAGGTAQSGGIAVKLKSATAGCQISYTKDGTTPTPTHGTIISNGATANITAGTTSEVTKVLKAIGCKSGMTPSAVRTGTYVLNFSRL